MKPKRVGIIKEKKMLDAQIDENGIVTYVCKDNKINAKLHPKFANRKEARQHIMKEHFLFGAWLPKAKM